MQLMRYFALVSESVPFERFRAKILEQLPGTEEIAMSTTWFEDQQEKALSKGHEKGRVDVLRRLLVLKFGSIDAEVDARILAAAPEILDLYVERVLTATTLAAVFAE